MDTCIYCDAGEGELHRPHCTLPIDDQLMPFNETSKQADQRIEELEKMAVKTVSAFDHMLDEKDRRIEELESQNTFWSCKKHTQQNTLRCAICDEQHIKELEAKLETSTPGVIGGRIPTEKLRGNAPEPPQGSVIDGILDHNSNMVMGLENINGRLWNALQRLDGPHPTDPIERDHDQPSLGALPTIRAQQERMDDILQDIVSALTSLERLV